MKQTVVSLNIFLRKRFIILYIYMQVHLHFQQGCLYYLSIYNAPRNPGALYKTALLIDRGRNMFNKINFGVSGKNIPIPPKEEYLVLLMSHVERLVKTMRWKLYWKKNGKGSKAYADDKFGLKSGKHPKPDPELSAFEERMTNLIRDIRFKPYNWVNKGFQEHLTNQVKKIRECKDILVKSDKTSNYYKLDPSTYNRLLGENITKDYKKAGKDEIAKIDKIALEEAMKVNVADRLEKFEYKEATVLLKDHKDTFQVKHDARLINPAKSQLGKIAKRILEKTIKVVLEKTKLNAWQSTPEVLDWFNKIDRKKKANFLVCDVKAMYASIKEHLVIKALSWARTLDQSLDDNMVSIIVNSCKSILVKSGCTWVKKETQGHESSFDVAMGSYPGAEICTIIGLFLLQEISNRNIFQDKNCFGLYRDDFASYSYRPKREIEHNEKKAVKALFAEYGLGLEAFNIGKSINFLDACLDLKENKHMPYRKPECELLYVHKESNHAASVIREIPKSIGNRLSILSSNNHIFDGISVEYEEALIKAGYERDECKLEYVKKDNEAINLERKKKEERKRRNRNVIWFTPPWNVQVKTNVGREFFKILDESFTEPHLKRIFNRNTIKLGYSTTRNLNQHIKGHNAKLARGAETVSNRECNCRNPTECPLLGKCVQHNVLYSAKVIEAGVEDVVLGEYFGCTDHFKTRYSNHKKSLCHEIYKNETELSRFVWKKREEGIATRIIWSIVRKAPTYKSGSHLCCLCTLEKIMIIEQKKRIGNEVLNERIDMGRKCPHKMKAKLI